MKSTNYRMVDQIKEKVNVGVGVGGVGGLFLIQVERWWAFANQLQSNASHLWPLAMVGKWPMMVKAVF